MLKTDSELIAEYLEGNEVSFDVLVARYMDVIYRFVARSTNLSEDSNDITQKVFLSVWKNIRKFDLNKNFKTWIFIIARNAIIDWYRKRKDIIFSTLDTPEVDFEDTLTDIEPLPDEMFSRKELGVFLEDALTKLPENYKTIIVLHNTENMTFEEISEVVGKPMNTVKSQYRRGIIQLRDLLKGNPKLE